MRPVVLLSFVFLAAAGAFGQRPGAPAHGGAIAGRPIPSRRAGAGYFPAFPFYYDGYDYGYAPPPPPVMPSLPPYVVVQPPPPIVHSEVHEYKPASANEAAAVQEPPGYALALRDGSVHFAVAVSVQNNGLHYVDPDGRHDVVALDAVDREATRRLNQERKLKLQLPVSTK